MDPVLSVEAARRSLDTRPKSHRGPPTNMGAPSGSQFMHRPRLGNNVFIIPGLTLQSAESAYSPLVGLIKRFGFEPHFININWASGKLSDWKAQAQSIISKCENQINTNSPERLPPKVIGFSYGAIIALSISNISPSARIICSAPNIFDTTMRAAIDRLTRKTYTGLKLDWADFENVKLASANARYVLLHGSEESALYSSFAKSFSKYCSKIGADKAEVRSLQIEGAGHDINSELYTAGLSEVLDYER